MSASTRLCNRTANQIIPLTGCMSIQLRAEAVLPRFVGSAPLKNGTGPQRHRTYSRGSSLTILERLEIFLMKSAFSVPWSSHWVQKDCGRKIREELWEYKSVKRLANTRGQVTLKINAGPSRQECVLYVSSVMWVWYFLHWELMWRTGIWCKSVVTLNFGGKPQAQASEASDGSPISLCLEPKWPL